MPDVLTDSDPSRINEAAVAQPACTALQIGLVSLLTSIGVSPVHVIGHSSGTYARRLLASLSCFTNVR
jgi:malonyl CoA-acyl carrier protein transacylase